MECWGFKGNHRYKDCPHINDKVRVVHNVQQAEKVEDMGISVPRIYVAHGQQERIILVTYDLSGRYDQQPNHYYFN
jgi:hypothetical protein